MSTDETKPVGPVGDSEPAAPVGGRRVTPAELGEVLAAVLTPGKDHLGRPYLRTTDDVHFVFRPGRRGLPQGLAGAVDIAWMTERGPERTPSEATVKRVVEQLRATAEQCEPDAPPPEELAADLAGGLEIGPSWSAGLDDLPDGWRVPVGYRVTSGGVWREPPPSDSDVEREPRQISTGPILTVRFLIDPDGNELADLAWRGTFGWQVRPVERFLTSSGKRLIAALANAGMPAIDSRARDVEQWIAAAEAANRGAIPAEKVARWTGWQPDDIFLLPDSSDRRILWRWPEQEDIAANVRPAGTLDAWRETIAGLADDPYPVVLLAAAFASALLVPLGLPTVIVDVYAASTRGKTTSLKIAYSVWGAPLDEGENGIASWGSTLLQLEKIACWTQGIVIALDDSQKAAREKGGSDTIRTFLYAASGGRGKARGNAAGSTNPNRVQIRTVILSSGEKPLTEFGQVQGLAPRRLPFPRNPFPMTDDPAAEARRIDRIMVGLLSNHGTAGPAFVEQLQDRLGQPDGLKNLRERHRALVERFRGDTPITARRAPAAAAVLLAGQLAHEWGILPVPPPEWQVWEDLFLGEDATEADDMGAAAVEVILGELAASPDRMWGNTKPFVTMGGDVIDRHPTRGYLAKVDVIDGEKHLLVNTLKARELLESAGYDYANVLRVWQGNKAILRITEGKGDRAKTRWAKRTTLGGNTRTECLVFSREAVSPEMLGLADDEPPPRPGWAG
jgi:hypothetical protein